MAALDYPPPIQRLIAQLKSLPGLGPRSAERLALWLMQVGPLRVDPLAQTLALLHDTVRACDDCGFFIEKNEPCLLCTNEKRNARVICVVEQAADVLSLERSGAFQGMYHVLGGKLSPLDNVTPEDLRFDSLMDRVQNLQAEEVILAVGSDVEGEATASYLAEGLTAAGVSVTRLAQGMPAGGALDHVDELTLFQALQGRRKIG